MEPLEVPAGVEPFVTELPVRFSDVDGMGHANNAKYLSYLEEARTAWAIGTVGYRSLKEIDFILAHVSIDYLAAATLGDVVRVALWVPRIGNRSWDFAYRLTDEAGERVFAQAMTTQVAFDYAAGRAKPLPARTLTALRPLAVPG